MRRSYPDTQEPAGQRTGPCLQAWARGAASDGASTTRGRRVRCASARLAGLQAEPLVRAGHAHARAQLAAPTRRRQLASARLKLGRNQKAHQLPHVVPCG